MEVQVQLERRAEPLDRRDGARLPGPSTALRPVEPGDAPKRDLQHTLGEILTPSEQPAASPRYGQDPLARRRPGDQLIDAQSRVGSFMSAPPLRPAVAANAPAALVPISEPNADCTQA